MTISVLMSTYRREQPAYLDAAMKSIWTDQTRKPEQVVVVKDGALTPELDAVIDRWKELMGETLTVVANRQNRGLALALNSGLACCTGDIVARMDSDDIAFPTRIEEQAAYLEQHSEVGVVGAWIDEFVGTPDNVVSSRKTPETHPEIYRYGQMRNPMNHPTVVFRRHVVTEHGGYQHFYLFEDYYLWSRLLCAGVKFHNLQKSLIWFRMSDDLYERRGGWHYAISELKFQLRLHKTGYISLTEMLRNCGMRLAGRLIPNSLRGWIYKNILRKE